MLPRPWLTSGPALPRASGRGLCTERATGWGALQAVNRPPALPWSMSLVGGVVGRLLFHPVTFSNSAPPCLGRLAHAHSHHTTTTISRHPPHPLRLALTSRANGDGQGGLQLSGLAGTRPGGRITSLSLVLAVDGQGQSRPLPSPPLPPRHHPLAEAGVVCLRSGQSGSPGALEKPPCPALLVCQRPNLQVGSRRLWEASGPRKGPRT